MLELHRLELKIASELSNSQCKWINFFDFLKLIWKILMLLFILKVCHSDDVLRHITEEYSSVVYQVKMKFKKQLMVYQKWDLLPLAWASHRRSEFAHDQNSSWANEEIEWRISVHCCCFEKKGFDPEVWKKKKRLFNIYLTHKVWFFFSESLKCQSKFERVEKLERTGTNIVKTEQARKAMQASKVFLSLRFPSFVKEGFCEKVFVSS